MASLTFYVGHAGAPGVLASPFAAMHGLGSPLTSPYGNSAVGGMGGNAFVTFFCSLLSLHLCCMFITFPSSCEVLSLIIVLCLPNKGYAVQ